MFRIKALAFTLPAPSPCGDDSRYRIKCDSVPFITGIFFSVINFISWHGMGSGCDKNDKNDKNNLDACHLCHIGLCTC